MKINGFSDSGVENIKKNFTQRREVAKGNQWNKAFHLCDFASLREISSGIFNY